MTVPIESIKPGTVWRFKSGLRKVIRVGNRRDGVPYDVRWCQVDLPNTIRCTLIHGFAKNAIEQVTAPERVGGG